jgi:phage tail sheath protein FI
VKGFFDNGGQRCFIARVVSSTAIASSFTSEEVNLKVEAIGEGTWGNRVAIIIKAAVENTARLRLEVYYWKNNQPTIEQITAVDSNPAQTVEEELSPTQFDIYEELSVNETEPEYFEKRVNGISNCIEIEKADDANPVTVPGAPIITYLAGGNNGTEPLTIDDFTRTDTANKKEKKGLTGLEAVDEISIVYSPHALAVPGLVDALKTHCETLKDRFAIIDSNPNIDDVTSDDLKPRNNPTQYAAFYYPWIKVVNPETGLTPTIPPGGHVAGIYARSDIERGVHKAPANEVIIGAKELEFEITKRTQDMLNPRGVNALRAFPGRGIRVWGARTLSDNSLWKYINVRRLFIFVEKSIFLGTQFVVFEPNDYRLWARVRATITQFLTGVWRNGALFGQTPEQAFFVKCDETTMTPDDIDNGRLICVIGIAPVRPAEFVIFRIAQLPSGGAVIE